MEASSAKLEVYLSVILASIQVGLPMIGIQQNFFLGVICWAIVAGLLIDLCWRWSGMRSVPVGLKGVATVAILLGASLLLWTRRPRGAATVTPPQVVALPSPSPSPSRAPHRRPSPTAAVLSTVALPTPTPRPEPTQAPEPVVTFDFQGQRLVTAGDHMRKVQGEEYDHYWKMYEMAKTKEYLEWERLRDFAEQEMRRVPSWITPQVYAGIAYSHVGPAETARTLLESATKRIQGNAEYAGLAPLIDECIGRMGQRMYHTDFPPLLPPSSVAR